MAAPRGQQRVALATVWDGVPDYACAVLHWCQHAQQLGRVLVQDVGVHSVDLHMLLSSAHTYQGKTRSAHSMVLSDGRPLPRQACRCKHRFCPECVHAETADDGFNPPPETTVAEDCPKMKIWRPEPRLRRAVESFSTRKNGGCKGRWSAGMLYKWWVVSLTDYALVILSDLDVQLLRPDQPSEIVVARWRAGWETAVPSDRVSRVLGTKDFVSPLNGGLWMLSWPSRKMYEDGLFQLEVAQYNTTHGFSLVGTPQDLYARYPLVRPMMNKSRMYTHNTWDIPFGDCDQGFLFYMFYLRNYGTGISHEPVPKICRKYLNRNNASCAHTATHYWGHRKPWIFDIDNKAGVLHYLKHTDYRPLVNYSHCARRFSRWAARLSTTRKSPPKFVGKLQRVF